MESMEKQLSFCEEKKTENGSGKRGDSLLHVAARAGNLEQVEEILRENCGNRLKEVMSIRNQDGETPLYVAAGAGQVLVVSELLKHIDIETAAIKAKNEVLRELLQRVPQLAMATDASNSTALHTAATQGHIDVVNFLLEIESSLIKITRRNGKHALHSAARKGHGAVVKSLLTKDPSMNFATDKKGQTTVGPFMPQK